MMPNANEEEFTKLADELEATKDPKYQQFIADLRNNEFHDFANEKYDTPKLEMIRQAEVLGRKDIADRVKNGDFDQ